MTAWQSKSGSCARCGQYSDRLFPAFGKYICELCKDNRPNKGTGSAGLRNTGQIPMTFVRGLHLQLVPKSDGRFGQLFFGHYPRSKGIVGRTICYLIRDGIDVIGIIGASSPPFNYRKFRDFFQVDDDNLIMNNNVFRLIVRRKNLGTQILRLFREKLQQHHRAKYKHSLIGIVTFVEPPRTGAVYKADNWDYLGMTEGKRMRRDPDSWEKIFFTDKPKHIYAYRYKG